VDAEAGSVNRRRRLANVLNSCPSLNYLSDARSPTIDEPLTINYHLDCRRIVRRLRDVGRVRTRRYGKQSLGGVRVVMRDFCRRALV
jgi:hypothetical protein